MKFEILKEAIQWQKVCKICNATMQITEHSQTKKYRRQIDSKKFVLNIQEGIQIKYNLDQNTYELYTARDIHRRISVGCNRNNHKYDVVIKYDIGKEGTFKNVVVDNETAYFNYEGKKYFVINSYEASRYFMANGEYKPYTRINIYKNTSLVKNPIEKNVVIPFMPITEPKLFIPKVLNFINIA